MAPDHIMGQINPIFRQRIKKAVPGKDGFEWG